MTDKITTVQYWKGKAKLAGYRSGEELWFKYWLDELEQKGIVSDIQYEPEKMILSNKAVYTAVIAENGIIKNKKVAIPNSGHFYTPDFVFSSDNEKVRGLFHIPNNGKQVYTDIKGSFSIYADSAGFPIKQAWIFQLYNIWVNKVVPDELFKKTFVPAKLRKSPKTGKLLPKYKDCLTVGEWMKG